MVRYWNECERQVVTRFLAMPICNIATGETMFDIITQELKSRGIPWDNLIGFASDTASVNGWKAQFCSKSHSRQTE